MFASFDPTALIGAVLGLIGIAIGAYVTIRVEQIRARTAAAEAAARRAERTAAQAKAEIEWITKGGPEW
jgi:xanthosine utilization system XapX-like protein